MATVAGAPEFPQVACRTSGCKSSTLNVIYHKNKKYCNDRQNYRTYGLSRNAPKAESCRPPGTGCSRESKVVGFVIRFTERALISSEERKPNSTPEMAEDMGCEIFIMASAVPLVYVAGPGKAQRSSFPRICL